MKLEYVVLLIFLRFNGSSWRQRHCLEAKWSLLSVFCVFLCQKQDKEQALNAINRKKVV